MIVTSHRELRNRRQRNVANGQISGTSHQGFMKLQLRQSQTRYVYRERGDKYQDQPPGFYEIPATAVTDQVCLYGKGVQIAGTSHQGFMKFQLQQSQTRYAYMERGYKYQGPATRVLWNFSYSSHRSGMFIRKGGLQYLERLTQIPVLYK